MTRVALDWLRTLPSVCRFFDVVKRDLQDGRSVIIGLPRGLPPTLLWDITDEHLRSVDLRRRVLDARSRRPPLDGTGLIAAAMDLTDADVEMNGLVERWDCPELVFVHGLDGLPTNDQRDWISRVEDWADRARTLATARARTPVVCVACPATVMPSPTGGADVRLTLRYWWGLPSSLEVRLHLRTLAPAIDAASAWRECLISGVAPGDPALVDQLLDVDPRSIDDLVCALCDYAQSAGITPCRDGVDPGDGRQPARAEVASIAEPGPGMADAWACGNLVFTPDYGVEVHPAVLALCGNRRALEHRLWRGQSPQLLPLIDRLRLSFCTVLQRRLGENWFQAFQRPRDDEDYRRLQEDPFAADLGYLVFKVLPRLAGPGATRIVNDWRSPLQSAWTARNELAHYRPLTFDGFRTLWTDLGGVDAP